jgi:hypothetical protein
MGGGVESHRARWAHQRLDFAKGGGDVMPEKLTVDEFLALFSRAPGVDRWVSSADSEEYLTLITYLVARQYRP